jgi:hypothetical protein
MLKNIYKKGVINQGIRDNSILNKFKKYNFARNNNPFIPIYPGDKVLVLPPWGMNKLSNYERKVITTKFPNKIETQYGTVDKVLRKRNLAIVKGVNKKEKYVSPISFLGAYEMGDMAKIKRKFTCQPVEINRVFLRDPEEPGKIVKAKLVRDDKGKLMRINKKTKAEIPLVRKFRTYAQRVSKRKEGPNDTNGSLVSLKSYRGENFDEIARLFVRRLEEKKEIESRLILKDK